MDTKRELAKDNDHDLTDNHVGSASIDRSDQYTVDDCISFIGLGWFQYKLLFLCGLVWVGHGIGMMQLTFLVPILKNDWNLESPYDGLIGSFTFAGGIIGTVISSIISDKYGRRKIVIYCNLLSAISITLSAFCNDIILLLICRLAFGFSTGAGAAMYILFIEYAPKQHRGSLSLILDIFWSIGVLMSVLLAWICLEYLNLRWYILIGTIPMWIVCIFYKWYPQSCRYLLAIGKRDKVKQLMNNLAIENNGVLPTGRLQLDSNINCKQQKRGQIKDIFRSQYRRVSILLMVSFILCVFSYYGISFISERYFAFVDNNNNNDKNNNSDSNNYWKMSVTSFSEILGLGIGIFFVDKIGRKNTMIYCYIIYGVCCLMLLFDFIRDSVALGVIFVFFGRMTISIAFMAMYVMYAEIYPSVIRTTALGFSGSLGRIGGIFTSFVSEDCSVSTGMLLYAIAGFVCCLCVIMIKKDSTGMDMQTQIDDNTHAQTKKSKSGHIQLTQENENDSD